MKLGNAVYDGILNNLWKSIKELVVATPRIELGTQGFSVPCS
ncbi:uncharacterized protein METZ01_LOCUS470878, partial [marine metagenome]